jgi:hypothetical protein
MQGVPKKSSTCETLVLRRGAMFIAGYFTLRLGLRAARVLRWREQVGDPARADGILDRLVHDAQRIEMRGDSMRKDRGKANA